MLTFCHAEVIKKTIFSRNIACEHENICIIEKLAVPLQPLLKLVAIRGVGSPKSKAWSISSTE